jgi:hypothetical protein
MAVKAGSPRPDISSGEAVKKGATFRFGLSTKSQKRC